MHSKNLTSAGITIPAVSQYRIALTIDRQHLKVTKIQLGKAGCWDFIAAMEISGLAKANATTHLETTHLAAWKAQGLAMLIP